MPASPVPPPQSSLCDADYKAMRWRVNVGIVCIFCLVVAALTFWLKMWILACQLSDGMVFRQPHFWILYAWAIIVGALALAAVELLHSIAPPENEAFWDRFLDRTEEPPSSTPRDG